ncbi:MAG: hypothetical protein QOE51_2398 [Actinoplanes sp.]|nr:hypothetical protein [Actinoplanes sp.]
MLNPLLAIAAELSRRGVTGLHVASEEKAGPVVEQATINSPITFHPHPDEIFSVDAETYRAITLGPFTTKGATTLLRAFRRPEVTRALYERTLAEIDRIRPGLMVVDLVSIGALDAAQTRGVPYILSVSGLPSLAFQQSLPWSYPYPLTGLPRLMSRRQKAAGAAFRIRLLLAMLMTLDLRDGRRRKAEGIANPFGDLEQYGARAESIFAYTVFGLEIPFPTHEQLRMLGTMIPPTASTAPAKSGELSTWLDQHDSIVYVNFGTLANLSAPQLKVLAEALTRIAADHHVLWKLPTDQQSRLPPGLPDSIRLVTWVSDQSEVFSHPHVRAVVTHGGANLLHESLYFGQPIFVMPFWLDCYDLATRVVDAGAGLAVARPPHLDADEITAKIERLLSDDSFRGCARHWSAELSAAGGVSRAADLILQGARVPQHQTP